MPSRRSRVIDSSNRPRKNRQTRNTAFALVIIAAIMLPVMATIAAGNNGNSSATATPASCDHWCGNGWATITISGLTSQISGGGCYDRGADGIDARFGDWQEGSLDYLGITGYRPGGATPTPATPGATSENPLTRAGGSADGTQFVLGESATISFRADGSGSFYGNDISNGTTGGIAVKGTFYCG
ncbi:MAG TPA: hypothetical protein VF337_04795 [Candidatus Limnocylindrales bacterium]